MGTWDWVDVYSHENVLKFSKNVGIFTGMDVSSKKGHLFYARPL